MHIRRNLSIGFTLFLFAAASAWAEETYELDIADQELSGALKQFAEQSGLQVVYFADLAAGKQAKGVHGTYSADAALSELLDDSDLSYSTVDERTYSIAASAAAAEEAGGDRDSGNGRTGETTQTAVMMARKQTAAPASRRTTEEEEVRTEEGPAKPLEEIVVTGTHIRGARKSAAPSLSFDRDEIGRSGYSNLEQLFKGLPQNFSEIGPQSLFAEGVSPLAQQNLDLATGIDLRGLGTQSTLTLLNGKRRAGSADGRVVDISAIPLSVIESVEIVTGGRSAVYGADAVAGVVNLVTRRDFTGVESQASFGWADAGGERMQVSTITGIRAERGGFVLAYDFSRDYALDLTKTDLLAIPTVDGRVQRELNVQPDVWRHSVFASGRFDLNDRVGLYADGLYTRKKFESLSRTLRPGATDESVDSNRHISNQYSATLGAKSELSDTWKLDVSAVASAVDNVSDPVQFIDFGGFVVDARNHDDSETTVASLSAVADGQLPKIFGIEPRAAVGAEARRESLHHDRINRVSFNGEVFLDNEFEVVADDDRTVRSAFAEFLLPFGSGPRRLELSIAGRYDDYSNFGSSFKPQAGIVWSPVDSLTLRTAYSQAFRAPALVELGTNFRVNLLTVSDPSEPGGFSTLLLREGDNPNLNPEEAQTWSVGFDLKPVAWPAVTLSASYFNIEYKGRIDVPAQGADVALVLEREDRFPDLITRDPTIEELAAILSSVQFINSNTTGTPFDPTTQSILTVFPSLVVFDDRTNNISVETVRGIDFNVNGGFDTRLGSFTVGANATYTLEHDSRITATSPAFSRLNEVGKPVDLRFRFEAGWSRGAWGAFTFVNYINRYANPLTVPVSGMASWTTTDLTVQFSASDSVRATWLSGFSAALTVNNLFDINPPRYVSSGNGLRYDATNASPLGRYLALSLTKRW